MEQVDFLLETARGLARQAADFLPKLLLAVIVLLAGWLLARLVRFVVRRALRAINFHVLSERAGIDAFLERGGVKIEASGILALLAYWLVILASLLVAFNGVGLSYATDLLSRVLVFIPKAFVAVLLLALGAYFARFAGDAVAAYCRNVEMRDAGLLGRLARAAILVFVVLIALDHLEFGGNVLRQSFLIVLGGVALALALAFGLGGRRWAAAWLQHWWPIERRAGKE
jgi:flagellar biosynthesis protein FliQ